MFYGPDRESTLKTPVVSCFMAFLCSAASAVPPLNEGQVCVAALPPRAKQTDHDLSGGKAQRREPSYLFSVQIGVGDRVELSRSGKAALVSGLSPGQRHKVLIRDGAEVIESFSFTFEEKRSQRLCLAYTPFYQTWSLEPARSNFSGCRCEWKS